MKRAANGLPVGTYLPTGLNYTCYDEVTDWYCSGDKVWLYHPVFKVYCKRDEAKYFKMVGATLTEVPRPEGTAGNPPDPDAPPRLSEIPKKAGAKATQGSLHSHFAPRPPRCCHSRASRASSRAAAGFCLSI